MTDDAIVIDDLTVRFKGKPAVDRLSLRVPAGAVYALLGDNGAGKSTTMKVLTGQLPPDGGSAEILGLNCYAQAYALRHRVGFVPEKPKFYDWMTVSEIGWFAGGFHRNGYRDRYSDWVQNLRLDPKKKLKELSKGGYARVGLAMALASEPSVLLLDEPTSGLDRRTRREFLATLVELAAEGRTILISSHSIAELERFASHAAFVKDGRVVFAATLDELANRFRRVSFRVVGAGPNLDTLGEIADKTHIGRTWQIVVRNPDAVALEALRISGDIDDFEESKLSLEEVYDAVLGKPLDRDARAPIGDMPSEEEQDEYYDAEAAT